eukprot:2476003-Amphidinium_carterae.1
MTTNASLLNFDEKQFELSGRGRTHGLRIARLAFLKVLTTNATVTNHTGTIGKLQQPSTTRDLMSDLKKVLKGKKNLEESIQEEPEYA